MFLSQLQKRFGGHIGSDRWFYAGFAGFTSRTAYESTGKFFSTRRNSDTDRVIEEVLEVSLPRAIAESQADPCTPGCYQDIEISYRWLERDRKKIVNHLRMKYT